MCHYYWIRGKKRRQSTGVCTFTALTKGVNSFFKLRCNKLHLSYMQGSKASWSLRHKARCMSNSARHFFKKIIRENKNFFISYWRLYCIQLCTFKLSVCFYCSEGELSFQGHGCSCTSKICEQLRWDRYFRCWLKFFLCPKGVKQRSYAREGTVIFHACITPNIFFTL